MSPLSKYFTRWENHAVDHAASKQHVDTIQLRAEGGCHPTHQDPADAGQSPDTREAPPKMRMRKQVPPAGAIRERR